MTTAFDALMSALDRPMAVVTTSAHGERAGCLVGFHMQSAIDPPRYTVWLSKANHTYRIGLRATYLAVHFLTRNDLSLAELFGTRTGDDGDKFRDVPVSTGPGGVPLLDACPTRLVGRRVALLDEGGDHVCVTTEVVHATGAGRFTPLLLSDVAHLTPGHDADERAAPPTERAK
jgi:flavin reductase (DIM6/NTAB) family NADH-FMN oxidoreductase RutF